MDNRSITGLLDAGLEKWAAVTGIDTSPPPPSPPPSSTHFYDHVMRTRRVGAHKGAVAAEAADHGVPLDLAMGIIDVESGGDPNYQGAPTRHGRPVGLYALMPHHFLPGEDPHDAATNARAAMRLLAHHHRATGDWSQAAVRMAYGDNPDLKDALGLSGRDYGKRVEAARAAYATPYGAT